MTANLNPDEELALDALLSEVHGAGEPSDFSSEILTQLESVAADHAAYQAVAARHTAMAVSRSRSRDKNSSFLIWLAISVAASLLLFVWWDANGDNRLNLAPRVADNASEPASNSEPAGKSELASASERKLGPEISSNKDANFETSIANSMESVIDSEPDPLATEMQIDTQPSKIRGIPLVDAVADSSRDNSSQNRKRKEVTAPAVARADSNVPAPKSEPIRLVSQNVDNDLRDYWRLLGIEPSNEASSEMVVQRVSDALGVQVDVEAVGDVESLRKQFATPSSARKIAEYWLSGITRSGMARLSEDQRSDLLGVFGRSISDQRGFDRALADLISGQRAESSAWYALLSEYGEAPMRQHLASITMNVDLRCTRCHDSLIEGNGTQHDYWSFAALLRTGLRRDVESGQFVLGSPTRGGAKRSFFYDLLDGRRRIAPAEIPMKWVSVDSSVMDSAPRIDDFKKWAASLNKSPQLARGLVNSFWQTLHGLPLDGSNIDTIAAPQNESLERLQQRLADDLIASEFNLARTIALIVASPSFRRVVPSSLDANNSLLASNEDRKRAMRQVDAFAGALPKQRKIGMPQRVAFVLRSTGAKIDLFGTESIAVLSQTDETVTKNSARNAAGRAKTLPADFPTRGSTLPLPWLSSVDSFDERVRHLAYLSGRTQVPDPVAGAVDAMRDANVDDELALQRTWWLLRN